MSTFICTPNTFSVIYQGLKAFDQGLETGSYGKYPVTAGEIQDWTFSYDGAEEIVKKLYSLNVRAVNEKYQKQTDENLSPEQLDSICQDTKTPTVGQFLKSLECLQYQMTEGKVPMEDTYNDLGRVIQCLKKEIGDGLEEYMLAEW